MDEWPKYNRRMSQDRKKCKVMPLSRRNQQGTAIPEFVRVQSNTEGIQVSDLRSRFESYNRANRNSNCRGERLVAKFPRPDPLEIRERGSGTHSSGSLFHVVCFQANRSEILTVPTRSRGGGMGRNGTRRRRLQEAAVQ